VVDILFIRCLLLFQLILIVKGAEGMEIVIRVSDYLVADDAILHKEHNVHRINRYIKEILKLKIG